METLKTILAFVVTLGFLITFHELGHFALARMFGIKVERFSIGFGKVLWSRTDKRGTEFAISLIPLGGYVSMLDDRVIEAEGIEEGEEQEGQMFKSKPIWVRFLVMVAGAAFNMLLAVLLFWILYAQPYYKMVPIIGSVEINSIADKAGLKEQDRISAIENREVSSWREVYTEFASLAGESKELGIEVRRGDKVLEKKLKIENFLNGAQKDLLGAIGIREAREKHKAVIGKVLADSAASKGGLRVDDLIVQIDGKSIEDWNDVIEIVQRSPSKELKVLVNRGRENIELEVKPDRVKSREGKEVGKIGAGLRLDREKGYDSRYWSKVDNTVIGAFRESIRRTKEISEMTINSIGKIFIGILSPNNISGPISIAKMAYNSANLGWKSFVEFLAIISISLGILNILPIPMLDGGQIVFLLLEGIGIKIREQVKEQINIVGFVFLMAITAMAIYFDIVHI